MARVRYSSWSYITDIAAGTTIGLPFDGLLRDILPDQAFRVLSLTAGLYIKTEPGDIISVGFAKNIQASVPATSDQLRVTHGHIWVVEHMKEQPTAQYEGYNYVFPMPEPLDFDVNDSLNVWISGQNSHATTPNTCEWMWSVAYLVG